MAENDTDNDGPAPTFIFQGADLILLLMLVFNEGREHAGAPPVSPFADEMDELVKVWKSKLMNMQKRPDGSSCFWTAEEEAAALARLAQAQADRASADGTPLH